MIRNYLKTAWRNLWKNKSFSAINIMGLSMGLACSLLILLWVQNERDIDAYNANDKQLYTVYERAFFDKKEEGGYGTQALLADELKKVIPDVKYATGFAWSQDHTFQVGDKVLKLNGTYAGADYFKMFSYTILQGKAESALNSPVSIAISKKMAQEFFGSPDLAIGKTIKYESQKNFTVSAVFDNPVNASVKFDFLINWNTFLDENGWAKSWGNIGPLTYIMLNKTAGPIAMESKLTHFLDAYQKNQKKGVFTVELGMQKFSEGYLQGNFTHGVIDGGRIGYVRLFSVVALFILLIACINFMNLTTARSVHRAREIGVRKVIGAVRSVLIRQFIGESVFLTCIAVGFALLLTILCLPMFNSITGKQIELPFSSPSFWMEIVAITLITGFVSGSYPALFLSSFKPVKVLKGSFKMGSGAALFRKGLVVFQFVLSVVLIISTIIISKQVSFKQDQNLGYDRENLVYIPIEGDLPAKYEVFKNEALKMPGIQMVSNTSENVTNIQNGTGSVDWDGKDPSLMVQFVQGSVGYDFVKTMKLSVLEGRDYSRDFVSDSVGYILNEAAVKKIGYEHPIGRRFTFWGKKGKIIGVLKDFHFNSMQEQIKPLVLRLYEKTTYGNILVRTQPGKTREAMASLQTLCKQLNPNFQFTYHFSDEEYQKLYNNEQVISKLSRIFASLAILISCLGLLGLAIFTTEQRSKEIGIRKVLGAGIGTLFTLLSSEFLILVGIALLIASPMAWWAMNNWLRHYAYSTPIEWWIFALSGLVAIAITLATISFQTLKAALISPVKSLRSE